MKKLGLMLLAVTISLTVFAQKDELKAAEKALKSGDVAAAKSAVDQAEGKLEEKYKSKFYFVKAKTYYELAKSNSEGSAYDVAAKSFQDLIAYEKENGKAKYTQDAQPMLNTLIQEISTKGVNEFQNKDYKNAKATLYKTYLLSPKDTVFLEYAAGAAFNDKDLEKSLEHYSTLKDLGYSGITTSYTAVNIETGERENMGSKAQMDLMVKAKQYKDPKTEVSESKKATIVKNIAVILENLGKNDEALAAVAEARKADPNDLGMLMTQANLLLKLGKKEEFAATLEEAIQQDPNNPSLHFNVGVILSEQGKLEEAKAKYKKALEIDPNFADAYVNLGAALLEKDKDLVEEMNNNLSNFKKYDEIKAKQIELYKEVVPLYEKAFDLKKEESGKEDPGLAQTLMALYENLELTEKAAKMRAIWKASQE